MSKRLKKFTIEEITSINTTNLQMKMMGGALVGLNILLMVFVGLYWTNPFVHLYFAGRPL